MSTRDVIRAWKDSTYRNTLSAEQRSELPGNPIGEVLSEEELQLINGGRLPFTHETLDDGCTDTCEPESLGPCL